MRKIVLLLGCSLLYKEAALAAKMYKVGTDETVYGVAYSHGIPTHALISANNLKPPYTLTRGQELQIPMANEHIVGQKETLQDIAEHYGVSVDVLALENGITSPHLAPPGTHLMIPSRDTESFSAALKSPDTEEISSSSLAPLPLVKLAPAPSVPQGTLQGGPSEGPPQPLSQPGKSPLPEDLAAELTLEKSQKKGRPQPNSAKPPIMGDLAQKEQAKKPVASGATKPSSPSPEQEKPKTSQGSRQKKEGDLTKQEKLKAVSFIWPVQGKIISKFAGAGKNDGLNIKVSEGTPVKAAAEGDVIYAGNELKSFGNLVLIKHKDGWVTAYAHNASLLVKKGDKVKQGQDIAKSGKTGDVKESQLHFELRKGKQPIDPLPKLGS